MSYINTVTKEYPIAERDIRRLYPETIFPKPFKKSGYAVVFATPKPTMTALQRVVESEPVLTDKGTWAQTWEVVDRFQDDAIPDPPEEGVVYKTKAEKETEFLEAEKKILFDQFKSEKQADMEAAWDAGVVTSINNIHMQAGKIDQDKLAAGLVSQQK